MGYFQQITSFATTVTVITDFRSVTKKTAVTGGMDQNFYKDGRGWIRFGAGTGGDGTKILSPCTSLVHTQPYS